MSPFGKHSPRCMLGDCYCRSWWRIIQNRKEFVRSTVVGGCSLVLLSVIDVQPCSTLKISMEGYVNIRKSLSDLQANEHNRKVRTGLCDWKWIRSWCLVFGEWIHDQPFEVGGCSLTHSLDSHRRWALQLQESPLKELSNNVRKDLVRFSSEWTP